MPALEEVMVYCTVGLWHSGNLGAMVYGVGGDKVVKKDRNGLQTSDEAFKAAYTDALSNAMKQLGVGADIHMGLFEDNKYVEWAKEQFTDPPPADPAPDPKIEELKNLCRIIADKVPAADHFLLDTIVAGADMQRLYVEYPRGGQALLNMIEKRRQELG